MQERERISRYRETLRFARDQLLNKVLARGLAALPLHTVGGVWETESQSTNLNGYLPGMLWQLAKLDDAPELQTAGEHCAKHLESHLDIEAALGSGHALFVSHAPWYELQRERSVHDVLIKAGAQLGHRFQHRGRFFTTSGPPDTLTLESLADVPLIQMAADATLDQDLARLVIAHGRTTRDRLVREDGSTIEQRSYDPDSHQFGDPEAKYGANGTSCWSRGLAWSLHSFTRLYELTQATEFLRAAERNAEYWLARVPPGQISLCDLAADQQPASGPERRDSCAAAIVASGLLDLARIVPEPARAIVYRTMAMAILDTLVGPPHLDRDDEQWQGILCQGCYDCPTDKGVAESLAAGDYFLVEALTKVVMRAE